MDKVYVLQRNKNTGDSLMVKKTGKRQKKQLKSKAMDKFELVPYIPLSDKEMHYKVQDVIALSKQQVKPKTREEAKQLIINEMKIPHYCNNKYSVHVRKSSPEDMKVGFYTGKESATPLMGITHVSIKTHDRKPISDWRDMQTIKNELIGEEYEAVELHPAESRLVDTANQYHLWVMEKSLDEGGYFPFGFHNRLVSYDRRKGKAVQRGKE